MIELEHVIKECCEEFNIPVEFFHMNTRKRKIVFVRQMAHTILKERFRWSYEEIAKRVRVNERDKCSHTTVMYSVSTIKGYMEVGDNYFIKAYNNINKRLDGYYGDNVKAVIIHFPKNEPLDEFIDKFKKRYPDVDIFIN